MASPAEGTTSRDPHGGDSDSDPQLPHLDLVSIKPSEGASSGDCGPIEDTRTIDSPPTVEKDVSVHPAARPGTGIGFRNLPLEIQQHILLLTLGPCQLSHETRAAIEPAFGEKKTKPKNVTEQEQKALETLTTLSLVDHSFWLAMRYVRRQYLKRAMSLAEFQRFLDSEHTNLTTLDLELDERSFKDQEDLDGHRMEWEEAFRRPPRNVRFIRFQCLPERGVYSTYQVRRVGYPRRYAMRLVKWAMVRTRESGPKMTWEIVERSEELADPPWEFPKADEARFQPV